MATTSPANVTEKQSQRMSALARRDALTPIQRRTAADAISARGFPFDITDGQTLAGYVAIRSECDVFGLMRVLALRGVRLALPSIVDRASPLVFRQWRDGDALSPGLFGIGEPSADAPMVIPDIVLVPLVAFDPTGHRIGYGAGFYDRTLAVLRALRPVIAIGVGFGVQQIAAIKASPHDVMLDYVLTENKTFDFRS